MTVTLTEATTADLDLLAGYMRELRRDDPMPTEAIVGFDTSVAAMRQLLDDESIGRAWIISAEAEPAGYVALTFGHSIEFGGRTAFVDEFFVDTSHRRRGVAREALRLASEQARSLGVRVLLLEVSPKNIGADRLYRAAGFVERDYTLLCKWLGDA
jgi:GNAT superfamily N-acetyltransferase